MTKTVQERIQVVDQILDRGFMLMTDPLTRGTLRNRRFSDGACVGYTFRLNNLSYRGIWISTIEDLQLTVDGQAVSKTDMLLRLGTFSCTIDNLVNHSDVFWAVADQCWIDVNKIGGLAPGDHQFEIVIMKRNDFGHSYGDGTDLEGYRRNAKELATPLVLKDKTVYTIKEGAA